MADIFISYAHEDASVARRLRSALMREGWSVWWDGGLQAGRNFNDAIEAGLRGARCVVVLWSGRSVASEYVREEASLALHLKRLLPVVIERMDQQAELPLLFRNLQTLTLLGWDGSRRARHFGNLVAQIRAVAGEPRHIGAGSADDDDAARHARAFAELRAMADHYLTITAITAPDWAERVRLKDRCGRDMVELMDDAGLTKADLAGESHEGLILALAWKIRTTPAPEDLFSLLDVATRAKRLHVRYRIILAIVSLHDAGMVPSTAVPMIRNVLSAYRADADQPLLIRLDQLDLSLTLRGWRLTAGRSLFRRVDDARARLGNPATVWFRGHAARHRLVPVLFRFPTRPQTSENGDNLVGPGSVFFCCLSPLTGVNGPLWLLRIDVAVWRACWFRRLVGSVVMRC